MSLTSIVLASVIGTGVGAGHPSDPGGPSRPLDLDTDLRLVETGIPVDTRRVNLGAFQDDDTPSPPAETAQTPFEAPPPPPPYGSAGTARWRFQVGKGVDVTDSSNTLLVGGLAYSKFFAKGLSLDLEFNGIVIDQHGDDAGGVNLNLLVRWHFLLERNWTLFIDGGAGVMYTNDEVPEKGSEFNFTPQAGIGFTRAIAKDVRLIAGARWQHMSNANLYSDNPGRDSVMGYIGLSFPF